MVCESAFKTPFFFLDKKETKNQACTEITPEFCPSKPKIHLVTRFARFKMNFYGFDKQNSRYFA
jgi:hypothetical protein